MTYWSQSYIETNTKTAVWKMTQLGLIDSKISKILVLMKFHCQICYKEIPLLYPSRLTVLFERSIDQGSFQKVNAKNIWNFPYVGRPPFSVRYRKLMENDPTRHPSPCNNFLDNFMCFLHLLFESFSKLCDKFSV